MTKKKETGKQRDRQSEREREREREKKYAVSRPIFIRPKLQPGSIYTVCVFFEYRFEYRMQKRFKFPPPLSLSLSLFSFLRIKPGRREGKNAHECRSLADTLKLGSSNRRTRRDRRSCVLATLLLRALGLPTFPPHPASFSNRKGLDRDGIRQS